MSSNITPQKRVREYSDKGLIVNDSNELYCKACKKSIDYTKKSSVSQHLETEIHNNNVKKLKTNLTINFNNEESRNNFHNDLIIWHSASNIPLDKLGKKTFTSFLNNYLRPEFKVPSVSTIRRSLPVLYKSKMNEMIEYFMKSKIAVMCDETTDSRSRYIFQIIFIKLDIFSENIPKLVETIYLDEVNHETVSRSIINILIQMKIPFENVSFFVSDNASYMKKAIAEEWSIYLNFCSELKPIDEDFDLEKWWISIKTRVPNLFSYARWVLADSERALSKYNMVLSDSRQSLTEENVKIHNFFYFNFNQHNLSETNTDESLDDIIPFSP